MKKILSLVLAFAMLLPILSVEAFADNEQVSIVGDVDGNGALDNSDAIHLLYNTIFGDEAYPVSQSCDFDNNGVVTNSDAIYLLYHILFPDRYTIPPTEPILTSPTAMEVAKDMGLGINLGNTFEAYNAYQCEQITYEWIPKVGSNVPRNYETYWNGTVTTQKVIDGMRDVGFDTVRIPVFWGNMMENDGTWTIHPDYLARIKEVVDYCQNAGLYAVVNIHHFDEFIIRRNSVEECERIFKHLWTQIAEAFKDYPYTVVFEGFNEYLGGSQFNSNGELVYPGDKKAFELTNRCNQAFVDAVRATGGNNAERVLIVSGLNTNIDMTTKSSFVMPTDTIEDRLMVSVHYVDNGMYWSKQIGSKAWVDYIDDQCDRLDRAFTSKGIPVFMGETTSRYDTERMASNAIYTDPAECLEITLTELLNRGFVPVLWDTDENFYSRRTYKIIRSDEADVIEKIVASLE